MYAIDLKTSCVRLFEHFCDRDIPMNGCSVELRSLIFDLRYYPYQKL